MFRQPTRRHFLMSAAATAVAAPLARCAPSERVRVGVVGVGNQGAYNWGQLAGVPSCEVVALCDVDERMTAAARKQFPKATFFVDYRKMIEAKGLDVSAPLRAGLRAAGDEASARCLDRVYQDEIGHVAAGTRWFRIACARAGVDAEARFVELARPFLPRRRVRALDAAGRRAAGFSERELAALTGEAGEVREGAAG